jgi:cysteine desulfurase
MKRVYLDYAAAAPVEGVAKRAFLKALALYGNPSSAHEEGRKAKEALEDARTTIARLAGVKSEHVVFTSGATEANTLAIEGHVRALLRKGRERKSIELMYHPGAHSSVVRTMERLANDGIRVVPLPTKGALVDIDAFTAMVGPKTSLVSLEAVSPETGMRHDIRSVRAALHAHKDAYLHVDASQLPLVESFARERLGADLVTLDAQKVGGVRGVGCLIRRAGVPLAPIFLGGGQEHELRSGTEAVAHVFAFAAALSLAAKRRGAFVARARAIRAKLIERIRKSVPDAVILGGADAAPHILALAFPGRDTDYLQTLLDTAGFMVGTKSACESDAMQGSRMAQSETGDDALSKATLRVSWGPATPTGDLMRFVGALTEAIRFLDKDGIY